MLLRCLGVNTLGGMQEEEQDEAHFCWGEWELTILVRAVCRTWCSMLHVRAIVQRMWLLCDHCVTAVMSDLWLLLLTFSSCLS